jgi:hypothetical protein
MKKTLAQLLKENVITPEGIWETAFQKNGVYTYEEEVDGVKTPQMGQITIQEAFSTPDASILFPKVISNVLEEAAEPKMVITPLLSVVRTNGRAVEFPAVGALKADEVPEGQEYPDQSLVFERRLEGKVSKKGVKVPITDEVIADSQWDIVGLHLRAAGRAMQRLKEVIAQDRFESEAVVVLDNSGGAGTYQTTGVDSSDTANGSLSLMDILTLAGHLIAEERNFTHLIMHPLAWMILAKDPVVRQFNVYGSREVYATRVPQGRNLYEDNQFLNMFPWVPNVILSPYVKWDTDTVSAAEPLTDIYAIDAEDIGSLLVREDVTTEQFDDPLRDIQTLKLKERYDIVVYGEHQIKVAQDVHVVRNYEAFA